MVTQTRPPAAWTVCTVWVLTHVAGVVLALVATFVAALAAGLALGSEVVDKAPSVPVAFVVPAMMQWFVLRKLVPRADRWVLASLAGCAAGLAVTPVARQLVSDVPGSLASRELVVLAFAAPMGAWFGVTQRLVLRRHFGQSGWWVPASIVGWVGAFVVVGRSLDGLPDLLLLAVAPPAVSGVALAWLSQQLHSGPRRRAAVQVVDSRN